MRTADAESRLVNAWEQHSPGGDFCGEVMGLARALTDDEAADFIAGVKGRKLTLNDFAYEGENFSIWTRAIERQRLPAGSRS